jgi:hypothetical protein
MCLASRNLNGTLITPVESVIPQRGILSSEATFVLPIQMFAKKQICDTRRKAKLLKNAEECGEAFRSSGFFQRRWFGSSPGFSLAYLWPLEVFSRV